jgi:two-component system, LuxR family, sensor kinase FixL
MIGQTISRFIPPPNGDADGQSHVNHLCRHQPGKIGIGREMTGRRKDGTAFPMELIVSDLLLSDHQVYKFFLRDLTVPKQLEKESRQHLMELAHVTRVSTLGELSSSLAHELNQPLTAILSNAQAAQRFLGKDTPVDLDEVRDILKDIVEQNQRAGQIIYHMRAMLKKGVAQLKPVDLNEVIREMLNILHSDLVARNVRVKMELNPRLPPVLCDRIQIQQVLMNLTLNSCDAMANLAPSERSLTIGTGSSEPGFARVFVADHGPGIPAGMTGKIFEPFYSTKENGLGMGLTICTSIVTAHGGRLWAENSDKAGAIFSFTIPFYKGENS